jgi:hypothetical protein
MTQQDGTKTDDMRALVVLAATGDTSVRFRAKRELVEALIELGYKRGLARSLAIAWISDHRRQYKVTDLTPESPQESKRPHVTVEWR